MRILQNTHLPLLEWRKRAYVLSVLVILTGFVGMGLNLAKYGTWMNYGVDFAGGTIVQVDFGRAVRVEQIRAAASATGQAWEISGFGGDRQFIIRMPTFQQQAGQDAGVRVVQTLSKGFPVGSFRIVRTEAVGPKVGAELQQRALMAILVSFLATMIYLAFRFEWRIGAASIVATAHDILITLGFIALTRMEVSLASVAALLTIVGYSLNDTIVVFDRIRENLAKPHGGQSYIQILDRSINETLSRTALTGGGTLATLLALYFLGGAVIQDFALVLILGIVIGTFSSIFVAAPVLYEIERRWPRKNDTTASRTRASGASRVESAV